MKYSYRNIDWDDYREYSKNKIDSYKLAVLNILEKNGVPVSSDFVHTFFFLCRCLNRSFLSTCKKKI